MSSEFWRLPQEIPVGSRKLKQGMDGSQQKNYLMRDFTAVSKWRDGRTHCRAVLSKV